MRIFIVLLFMYLPAVATEDDFSALVAAHGALLEKCNACREGREF
jgi:hypothetical protein